MGEVIDFNGVTTLPLDPQRVLDAAKDKGLTTVVVIGYNEDGSEYFASSLRDGPEVLWMLLRAERKLLAVVDESTP